MEQTLAVQIPRQWVKDVPQEMTFSAKRRCVRNWLDGGIMGSQVLSDILNLVELIGALVIGLYVAWNMLDKGSIILPGSRDGEAGISWREYAIAVLVLGSALAWGVANLLGILFGAITAIVWFITASQSTAMHSGTVANSLLAQVFFECGFLVTGLLLAGAWLRGQVWQRVEKSLEWEPTKWEHALVLLSLGTLAKTLFVLVKQLMYQVAYLAMRSILSDRFADSGAAAWSWVPIGVDVAVLLAAVLVVWYILRGRPGESIYYESEDTQSIDQPTDQPAD